MSLSLSWQDRVIIHTILTFSFDTPPPVPHPSPITNPVTRTRTSSRVTYTRSPGPGPGPPQGSPVIVMQVRRLKVAGMGLEKPKLLCYVFILSLSDGESPYIHTPPCSTCNTELSWAFQKCYCWSCWPPRPLPCWPPRPLPCWPPSVCSILQPAHFC